MKITIVPDDSAVGVDGVFRRVDTSALAMAGVHAVQFNTQTGVGTLETKTDGNHSIDSVLAFDTAYGAYLGAWTDAAPQTPTPTPTPPDPISSFAPLEFMERFTDAEQLAVAEATLVSAPLKLWYDKMLAATYITLSDPRTVAGVDALVAAGLLTSARRTEILTPDPA